MTRYLSLSAFFLRGRRAHCSLHKFAKSTTCTWVPWQGFYSIATWYGRLFAFVILQLFWLPKGFYLRHWFLSCVLSKLSNGRLSNYSMCALCQSSSLAVYCLVGGYDEVSLPCIRQSLINFPNVMSHECSRCRLFVYTINCSLKNAY